MAVKVVAVVLGLGLEKASAAEPVTEVAVSVEESEMSDLDWGSADRWPVQARPSRER